MQKKKKLEEIEGLKGGGSYKRSDWVSKKNRKEMRKTRERKM